MGSAHFSAITGAKTELTPATGAMYSALHHPAAKQKSIIRHLFRIVCVNCFDHFIADLKFLKKHKLVFGDS